MMENRIQKNLEEHFANTRDTQIKNEVNISKTLENNFDNTNLNEKEWEMRDNFIENIKLNNKKIEEAWIKLHTMKDKESEEYYKVLDEKENLQSLNFHIMEELLQSIEKLYGPRALEFRKTLENIGMRKSKIKNSLMGADEKYHKEAVEMREKY